MLRALILPPMNWTRSYQSFTAGTGPNPHEVYEVLAEHGFETEILDPHQLPWNPFAGRNTLLDSLDITRALRVLITRRHVDIVVSVAEGGAVPLVMARSLFGFLPPIVLWDLGLTEKWKLRERVLDISVPRVEGIMVLSESQVPYITNRWHPKTKPRVIHHHVDTTFFRPGDGLEGDYVLSVGDDVGRDFGTLMRALEGFGGLAKIKTSRLLVDETNVPDGVEVLRERSTYINLRTLYERSSFVVIPLHQTINASGVSTILEAGAMGKASVVSENNAIRDFIRPGETCLAVPCGDEAAMRDAMEQLASDRRLRNRLGINAREFVVSRFANRVFADGLAVALMDYCR